MSRCGNKKCKHLDASFDNNCRIFRSIPFCDDNERIIAQPGDSIQPEPERGVIHPPELRRAIDSLLGKVNKVTSSHRHGLLVPKSDLTSLANKQLDTEETFRKVGLL